MYKYLIGSPKQYRFNGQNGQFNINGDRPIMDKNGKFAESLTIQPIAYRVFSDTLFGRDKNEAWVELFFLDNAQTVGSIMFNNSSANEFVGILEEIFYDDKKLTDCLLTIKAEAKSNKKGSWFLARFETMEADPATVEELAQFDQSTPIYRADTITQTAEYRVVLGAFFERHLAELTERRQAQALQLSEAV